MVFRWIPVSVSKRVQLFHVAQLDASQITDPAPQAQF